ncbi:hypothetical protein TNCT_397331 [Trichonephila clavata]|uniref:Uncharacterized protein n=1 Tax=Trichonephila clavata TaxID=2740835 RepID=A0A8X6GRM9_TRICU|nr:hypothetical protein TNCT_397331 [Trichonephila clavata]
MNALPPGLEEWWPLIRTTPLPFGIYNRPQDFTTNRMGQNRIVIWDFASGTEPSAFHQSHWKIQSWGWSVFIALFVVRRSGAIVKKALYFFS